MANLNLKEIENIDWTPYEGFANYIGNEVFSTLLGVRNRVVLLISGNQFGKTLALTRLAVYRYMGLSKIPSHNILPDDKLRTCRFASEMLPTDSGNEVRHTVYPALKMQMPTNMLVKDITIRSPVMTVQPLLGGKVGHFEFVSYGQSAQSKAGQQRRFIIADEVPTYEFHEESMPRLAATNGQVFYGMTPVEAGWTYEEIYERARTYYRTKIVRDFLQKSTGQKVPSVEHTDSLKDICVIQAASDDSPIYKVMLEQRKKEIKEGIISIADFPYDTVSEYLDSIYMYDDPDAVAMRRYGVFRQITGAVHKEFNMAIHCIPEKKHFADGVPQSWKRARLIDYHQSVPWAVVFICISPDDEAFVFNEFNPDPRNSTTLGIAKHIVDMGHDDKFQIDLIDPLAGQKQTNTNTSVIEDLNRIFREMKHQGLGTGAYWQPWDTKGTKGQDKVRERLINSKICGRPFNNLQKIDGKEMRIPTLWILDNCRQTAQSLKSWKMEEWVDRDALVTKDQKDKPQSKWSHFNCCLEAIFKDSRFSPIKHSWMSEKRDLPKRYFQSGGR